MANYEEQNYYPPSAVGEELTYITPASVGAEIPEEFTRRERMRGEDGFMQMALLSKPGRIGAVALAGIGLAVVAKIAGFVGVTTERDLSVKNIQVGLTGTTAVANQEWLTFTTVASADAEYKKDVTLELPGPFDPSPPASIFRQHMENMPFNSSVLNEATDLNWVVEEDGKVHIKFDPDAFMVKVYPDYQIDPTDPDHPFKNYFTDDPNWVAGMGGITQDIFKAMPLPEGITPDEIDDVDESLKIAAIIAGTEASAKACTDDALEESRPEIEENLVETVRDNIEQSAEVLGVDPAVVDELEMVVDSFPTEADVISQYEGLTKELNKTEGLTVSMPDYKGLICEKVEVGAAS